MVGTIAPDPDGGAPLRHAAVRTTYDAAGRVTVVEKGELAGWQDEGVAPAAWPGFAVQLRVDTQYDVMGRKVAEQVSGGGTATGVTQLSYDASGQLECTAVRMNPAAFGGLPTSACTLGVEGSFGPDRITRNAYDAAGQLLTVIKAYGTPLQQNYAGYSYSPNGKRLSVTDANGNRAEMGYDGHDRQDRWTFPSRTAVGQVNAGDYEAYGYDANGNRTSLRKRDGRTITYGHDALNRVTNKTYPQGGARGVYYDYDLRGLQTAAWFDGPNGADAVTTTYTGFGEVASSTTAMGGFSRTLTYLYDANGNRTRVTHPDGHWFHYSYDGLDRHNWAGTFGSEFLFGREFNAQGLPALEYRIMGGVFYRYDATSRLTHHEFDLTGTAHDLVTTLAYNPAGQIVTRGRSNEAYAFTGHVNVDRAYATNGLNQYTSAGPASFAYDGNGNLTSDGSTGYTYDPENRLVSSSTGATLVYDPQGRLWSTTGSGGATTRFVYDGDQLTLEYDGAGNVLRRYVHGAGDDDPLAYFEGASVAAAQRRAFFTDHQGSVVATGDPGGSGSAINGYDEYGITSGAGGAIRPNGRFGYTGQAWLPELGMYHYKARIYSPTLGRFLQTDPIGYDDQVNLYAYVANDPVNGRDPSGEDSLTCSIVDGKATGCTLVADKKDTTTVTFNETRNWTGGDGKQYSDTRSTTQTYQGSISQEGLLSRTFVGVGDQILKSVGESLSSMTGTNLALSIGSGADAGNGSALGAAGGLPRNLGNLGSRAGERAADVAKSRGATGANLREMGPWADKTLGEVARAAAQGNQQAAKALKIAKEAGRLGQKY